MEIKDLDIALGYFYDNRNYVFVPELNAAFGLPTTNVNIGNSQIIIQKLLRDGHVETNGSAQFRISFDGILFFEAGGYTVEQSERARLAQLEYDNLRSQVQLNQSTIETNSSIIITNASFQQTNRAIVKLNKRSLWLAGASAAFIIVSIILQALDRSPQAMQNMTEQLRRQSIMLDSIRISLEKTDSAIQKAVSDSLYQR